MRRFWSYLILSITTLLLVGVSFTEVFKKNKSNMEYREGTEIVFRVENKDDNGMPNDEALKEGALDEVASEMAVRLDNSDISTYTINKQGDDTLAVSFRDYYGSIAQIQNLLAFDGNLALTSKSGTAEVVYGDDFIDGEATVETYMDVYPSITIPVKYDAIKTLVDTVLDAANTNNEEFAEHVESGEQDDSGEAHEEHHYYIYLWNNFQEDDTYDDYASGNYSRLKDAIFLQFEINEESVAKIKENNELTAVVNLSNYISSTSISETDIPAISRAFRDAKYYVNLINCTPLDYKVTYLYQQPVSALADNVFSIEGNLNRSSTLVATICAIAVIAILLMVFYKIGSLTISTTTLSTLFATIGFGVLVNAEFNTGLIIGLITVAVVSLISGILYAGKFKEECYRGRSLKKANTEAAKRSLLPIVDIHVVTLLISIFTYVLSKGNIIIRSFSAVAVLGSIVSLLINTLVLRGLYWLSTNATGLQGKYELFGVESDKVPNLIKEEKQTFFGEYANKDLTKKNKLTGFAALGLFLCGLTGLIVFSSISDTTTFANKAVANESLIYIEGNNTNALKPTYLTINSINDMAENTYLYEEDANDSTKLSEYVASVVAQDNREIIEDGKSTYYFCFTVKLNNKIDDSLKAYYSKEGTSYSWEDVVGTESSTLSEFLTKLCVEKLQEDTNTTLEFSVKTVETYNLIENPSVNVVVWGALIGVGASALYLMLRYRLSRGLASFVAPVLTATGVTGLFALLHFLKMGSISILALPFIAIYTLAIAIVLMNKEREMVLEDKNRDASIENRQKIMVNATSAAFSTILVVGIVVAYLTVNFFGFGASATSPLFLICTLGVIGATALVTIWYGSFSQFLYKVFSKANLDKIFTIKRKQNKKPTQVVKTAEPEEYTFIGIND